MSGGPDVAGAARVDRLDRHPGHRPAAGDAGGQDLHLELEAALRAAERRLHEPAPDQAVAGLVVGDGGPDGPRERPATQRVGDPPGEGHPREVPPPDDEVRPGAGPRREGIEEGRDLRRVVLPVAVEGQRAVVAAVEGQAKPGPEGGALAGVGALFQHLGAGLAGHGRGVVRGAVVHHEDGKVRGCPADHGGDPPRLVVGRDQGQDTGRAGRLLDRHRSSWPGALGARGAGAFRRIRLRGSGGPATLRGLK